MDSAKIIGTIETLKLSILIRHRRDGPLTKFCLLSANRTIKI